jgi:hypothetical protein
MSKQDHSRPSVIETPSESVSPENAEETSPTGQTPAPTEAEESLTPERDQGGT